MRRYCLLMIFLFLGLALPASAHWADMAAMDLRLDPDRDASAQAPAASFAEATYTLPTPFVAQADRNRDGWLSSLEIKGAAAVIAQRLAQDVVLLGDGAAGQLTVKPPFEGQMPLIQRDGFSTVLMRWQWNKPVSHYHLRYTLFPPDAPQAHCLVSVQTSALQRTLVFNAHQSEQDLTPKPLLQRVGDFLLLGIEHIATGYDHILFLIALLLVGGRFLYLVKIVTAFTVAHSLTLTLAVLGWVSLDSRFIESFIAASIVYVAAENLWRKEGKEPHWGLVFFFGLVHGLGFANILKAMAIPTQELLLPMVSFNLGIELGQMAIVTLAWLVLAQLARIAELKKYLRTGGSVAIMLMALVWFVERAFLGS